MSGPGVDGTRRANECAARPAGWAGPFSGSAWIGIVAACTDGDPVRLADAYSSYGSLKQDVADAVLAVIEPLQKEYALLATDPGAIDLLAQGRDRAIETSAPRLRAAVRAMGLAGSAP